MNSRYGASFCNALDSGGQREFLTSIQFIHTFIDRAYRTEQFT